MTTLETTPSLEARNGRDRTEDGEAHLRLVDLVKNYAAVSVVQKLNVEVRRGELIALLGPSGCGKTTTLRMIAGLIAASSGRILVDGREVQNLPAHSRDMGLVFQSYALFPHMTIARNVAFGLEMRKVPKADIARRVKAALDLVQLGHLSERRPRELSGGQQQRVALARALVVEPSILLLDEPLSNLDAKLRDQMRVEIRDIQQRLGITTVFVTHDQVEALSMCDRIAVMEGGRLAQIGTPNEIYEDPATPFVAEFVGRINKLPGRVGADGAVEIGAHRFRPRAGSPASGVATLMVRPHRIRISDTPATSGGLNAAAGTVTRATYIGDIVEYAVDVGGSALQVEHATGGGRRTFAAGDRVHLDWSPEDTLLFSQGGER